VDPPDRPVCGCASAVYLCVYVVCMCSSSRSYFWSIFTKIRTDVKTPKSKNEFVGSTSRHSFPYFAPTPHFIGQEVLKIHAGINNTVSAFKCTRIAEIFASFIGNRCGGIFERNYLRIYWTNFHQIFTVLQVFNRILPIWTSFSDRARDVAMVSL